MAQTFPLAETGEDAEVDQQGPPDAFHGLWNQSCPLESQNSSLPRNYETAR
jgi:hypothetical protein